MIERHIKTQLVDRLAHSPAVALLGPRQVGKTTLAQEVGEARPSLYLDLESEADRAKLTEPELYLSAHEGKLVILDEVHRVPELFRLLRGLIDRGRRKGLRAGRFLLLGSASMDLLAQSSESLAGRISYLEMGPVDALEIAGPDVERLWIRGGFPDSYLAGSDRSSQRWRQDFIRTYLERDIPTMGPRIPAETLRRFWTMLAHHQSGLLNASEFARSLGVTSQTVANYLDLLVDLLLVRRLAPWHSNGAKRLVKSPRVYVRDSGLVHTLLGLTDREAVLGHPVAGASWEGFVIESLVAAAPEGTEAYFYRTSAGAEIDLLLRHPDGRLWVFEVKRSLSPKVERGFHSACEDLSPDRRILIYPGSETFPLGNGIEVMSLSAAAHALGQGNDR
ncbi:ATP-binding protein [Sphingobium agri]|uniref:ATP-binding protein n=1 Tax=Sphingobium agri TaxID=2933566 RepID=A0ABT0E1V2_9SPHN|nr:ATP-binding protein [Sphingobium agri]MCK0533345.1 ATP-binding protein [Sphingobium agri]